MRLSWDKSQIPPPAKEAGLGRVRKMQNTTNRNTAGTSAADTAET